MDNIYDSYDFGLLQINCIPFKKSVIEHCEALEHEITHYLKSEFNEKMRAIQSEINFLKGRLDE